MYILGYIYRLSTYDTKRDLISFYSMSYMTYMVYFILEFACSVSSNTHLCAQARRPHLSSNRFKLHQSSPGGSTKLLISHTGAHIAYSYLNRHFFSYWQWGSYCHLLSFIDKDNIGIFSWINRQIVSPVTTTRHYLIPTVGC